MRTVCRSALVPYSADQMYALVADIDRYPEFLPWCSGTTVHHESDDAIEATIEMQRAGISKSFRTRNLLKPGRSMQLALIDGPFRQLVGNWRFETLGDTGCKVSLELDFEFESRATDAVFGAFFETTCNSLIDSFVHRANTIYGGGQA